MTRTFFTIIFTVLFTLTNWDLQAQNQETRDLGSFSRLSVGEAIKVYIKEGSNSSAKIEARGVDLDEVLTEVSGDRLKIHLDGSRHNNTNVTVWLTYTKIEDIEVSSAASVITESVLKTSELSIEVSSAANGKLEVEVDRLNVDVTGAGDLGIIGKARVQDVTVSSAGNYNAYDLACEESEVSASSAGGAKVTASKKIDANASSAGSVRYRGNPEKVYVNSSSGGSAKKAN